MTEVTTYKSLLAEKERLKLVVEAKKNVIKEIVKEDVNQLRESMKPATDALSVIGKLTHRDKSNPLINFGVDFLVDIFIKKMILARVGWLPRLIVPYVIKNFGSNILEENKKFGFLKKIFKN